jgi:hypothetical protein
VTVQEKLRLVQEKIQNQKALSQAQQQNIEQHEATAKPSNDYLALYNSHIQAALQVRKTSISNITLI